MLPTGTFLYRQNELLASLPTIFFDYSTFVLDIHAQFFVAEYLRCQYTASLQKYFLGLQLYTSILQPMAEQYGFSKPPKQYTGILIQQIPGSSYSILQYTANPVSNHRPMPGYRDLIPHHYRCRSSG